MVLVVLMLSGLAGASRRDGPSAWPGSGVVLFAIGAAAALGSVAIGQTAVFPLPSAALGTAAAVAVDRLGALFLLLLFVVGLALAVLEPRPDRRRLFLGVAATGAVVVCGDGVLLAAVAPLAVAALGRMGGWRVPVVGVVCGVGLVALLLGSVPGVDDLVAGTGYGVLRDRVVAGGPGGTGTAVALLVVAVAAVVVGASKQLRYRRRGAVPGPSMAFAPLLCQYLLLRVGFDLGSPLLGTPTDAAILLVGGAATVAVLSARALLMEDLRHAVALLVWAPVGLTVETLGTVSAARSLDLPGPQAAAAAAAVVLAVMQVLIGCSLWFLCEAVVAEQGAVDLRRLGGAARSMPRAMALAGLAACCLAWVPPFPGYSAAWILFHATLATAKFMSSWWTVAAAMIGVVLAAAGMVAAALAWVRVAALVALDKPRTPRAAAALDLGTGAVRGHAVLLVLAVAAGLAPGALAHRTTVPNGAGADATGTVILSTVGGGSGYGALVVLLLLASAVLAVRSWRSRFAGAVRLVPAWNGGMKADPPWLPFGDPVMQPGPRTIPAMIGAELGNRAAWRAVGRSVSRVSEWTRRLFRASHRVAIMITASAFRRPVLPVAVAVATILVGWWLGT